MRRLGNADVVELSVALEAVRGDLTAAGGGDPAHALGLAAGDDPTVLAHGTHELAEGVLEILDGAVMVEVVRLDVGDHDDGRVKEEEGAVGLVCLGNVVLGLTAVGVRVIALDEATDEERRVELHAVKHGGDHRRRGGLAVGTRNRDGLVAEREGREHLGARPDVDAELAGADDLGVGLRNGRRDDDDVRVHGVDRRGVMANVDLDAGSLELADVARALEVAAGDVNATLVEDERDAAHAGTTNADDVDALERKLPRSGCHAMAPLLFVAAVAAPVRVPEDTRWIRIQLFSLAQPRGRVRKRARLHQERQRGGVAGPRRSGLWACDASGLRVATT